MSGLYPDDVTQEQIDRWNGELDPPSDICPRCESDPCTCLMDDDPSDPLPEGWENED